MQLQEVWHAEDNDFVEVDRVFNVGVDHDDFGDPFHHAVDDAFVVKGSVIIAGFRRDSIGQMESDFAAPA